MSNDKNAHGSDEKAKELAVELGQATSVEFQQIKIEQSIHAAQQSTLTQPQPTVGEALGKNLAQAGLQATADPSVGFAAYTLLDTASKNAGAAFADGDYETGGWETAKAGAGGLVLGFGVATAAGAGTIMGTVGTAVFIASGVGAVAGIAIFGGAYLWNRRPKKNN
jgi:hypothetical protein